LERVAFNARTLLADETLESDDWNDLSASVGEIIEYTTRREYETVPTPGDDEANLLAAGELALESLDSLAEESGDSDMIVPISLYALPLGFWLGTFASGYLGNVDQGDRFVEKGLKWQPVLLGPLKSVLFAATWTSDPTLPLPWERALLDRLVGYLSLPLFAPDVDVFLEEGHRNLRVGELGSASVFFRGAAIHDPACVEAHTSLVLAQISTTWDEDWVWGGPSLADMESAISAFRQAANNADALEIWRTHTERWHYGETDPLLLVAEALARLHVIEPAAHIPKGFTGRWPLVQIRALFTAGMPGDEELHRRIRDLEDGQRAIYSRMDLGFQLAAKELSLAGLAPTPPADSFAYARSRATVELQGHLGDAWRRLGEPAKTHLFEAESLYQLQAPGRLGAPVAVVQAYTGALEAWLRTLLGGDQTLAGYAHDLQKLGRFTSRFDVPSEQQDLYGRTSSAREFWSTVVPTSTLGGRIHSVRNNAAHAKGSATWEDLENVRDLVLGEDDNPGLVAQAPDMPPLPPPSRGRR